LQFSVYQKQDIVLRALEIAVTSTQHMLNRRQRNHSYAIRFCTTSAVQTVQFIGLRWYRIFSNLIRTLFTVTEG